MQAARTPYLKEHNGRFTYVRRVPEHVQAIVGLKKWKQALGTDEGKARRRCAELTDQHDKLCSVQTRRLIEAEGGADKLRRALQSLWLDQATASVIRATPDLHAEFMPSDPANATPGELRESLAMLRQADRISRRADQEGTRLAAIDSLLSKDPPSLNTISVVAADWFKRRTSMRPSTRSLYERVLDRFQSHHGDVDVASVTRGMVRDYADSLAASGASPDTAMLHVRVLSSFFDYALRGDLVSSNPAAKNGPTEQHDARGRDPKHHPMLPPAQCPAFMHLLSDRPERQALALRLLILTGMRNAEVVNLTWQEIDLKARTITVPVARMKGRATHVIPLSAPAVALLKALPREGERVFPRMFDAALRDYMRLHLQVSPKVAVPHGFRRSLSTWAYETKRYDKDAIELCLAHAVKGPVQGAYWEGTMLEKRRVIMRDWAKYLSFATPR